MCCVFDILVRSQLDLVCHLHFQSRYNVSNLVGYYYAPLAGEGTDTMYSIKLQVTFSTTGDENEMLITSVDGSNA